MTDLERARRVGRLSDLLIEIIEREPEPNLGDFLAACITHLIGMSLPWEELSGETMEQLTDLAETAIKVGKMS